MTRAISKGTRILWQVCRGISTRPERRRWVHIFLNVVHVLTRRSQRLARSIFRKLRDRHRKYLVAADFYPAFSTREEAEKAFHIFDSDANGDLSRAEIKIKLVKTYQERRFLSRSLKDVGDALKTLNRILRFFALVILFFISLSVFGVSIGDSLSSVYTLCIAASFIFKNSASNAFDAIMFLFVSQ